MRYFLELSYNGKEFCGWQKQPNGVSVQELIEEKLSILHKTPFYIYGAGRTDAGVHAYQMYAHFDTDLPLIQDLVNRLNKFLPPGIAIHALHPVSEQAHARFSACERTYLYKITNQKNPFFQDSHWYVPNFKPDMIRLNDLSAQLFSYKDFTSFARSKAAHKTAICELKEAFWEEDGGEYVFKITANRFLRNMVRAIVGTLVEMSIKNYDIEKFKTILEQKDRKFAGSSAPAHGLYLSKITYPAEVFI